MGEFDWRIVGVAVEVEDGFEQGVDASEVSVFASRLDIGNLRGVSKGCGGLFTNSISLRAR